MSAVVVCFLLACSSKESGKISEKAQKNLDAFHAIVNAFTTGDNSKIDDVVAADYVDHSHPGATGLIESNGYLDAQKQQGYENGG